ncbi:MAG TPA: pyrroloquinoline quinone biosynthesis peptide chaperone PqqD [Afipia sp.]
MRNRRLDITDTSRPILARHARMKFDERRQVWVILVPERVLAPDETAVEVLQLCDGVRTVAKIVDELSTKYTADRELIFKDVIAMLRDLAEKGFLAEVQDTQS